MAEKYTFSSFFILFFFASNWKFPVFLLRVNKRPLNEKKTRQVNSNGICVCYSFYLLANSQGKGKENRAIDFKSPLRDENQVHIITVVYCYSSYVFMLQLFCLLIVIRVNAVCSC